MVAPLKLAHMVLRTSNLAEMRDWYCAVLEMDMQFENDMIGFATFDDEHHRVAFINAPNSEPRNPDARGVDHVAFTYPSLGDLLENYVRLKAEGIEPYRTINHGPTTSMYYADPDGNRIELQIDNFATMEEAVEYINSDAFAENPIGVEFDADRLVARFRQGDPHEELIRQGSA